MKNRPIFSKKENFTIKKMTQKRENAEKWTIFKQKKEIFSQKIASF